MIRPTHTYAVLEISRTAHQSSDGNATESETAGMVDGIPREVECGFYGNSVAPAVAEYVGRLLPLNCDPV